MITLFPTISIQIPFIILGSRSVPEELYTHTTQHTKPLEALHTLLHLQHPDICIALHLPNTQPCAVTPDAEPQRKQWIQHEEARWQQTEAKHLWILRCSGEEGGRWVGRRGEGDMQFVDQERKLLDKHIWTYEAVLQRFDVPIPGLPSVLQELRGMLDSLRLVFDRHDNDLLRVMCGAQCGVRVEVCTGREFGWAEEGMRKWVLAVVGWEREVVGLSSLNSVLECWQGSRFLEYWRVSGVRRQERMLLTSLERKKDLGNIWWEPPSEDFEWDFAAQRWIVKDDEEELWRWVDGVVRRGELGGVVRDMERFEIGGGRRLAVSFPISRSPTTISDRPATAKEAPENRNMKNCVISTHPIPTRMSTPEPKLDSPDPFTPIQSIVFQSHRGTIDSDELLAYIDVIASLTEYVTSVPYDLLLHQLSNFRSITSAQHHSPQRSLLRFLIFLKTSQDTQRFYREMLRNDGPRSPAAEYDSNMKRAWGPFKKIIESVERKRRLEREYVGEFIERYEDTGGFMAVSKTKLIALAGEEEKRRKRRNEEKKEEVGGQLDKLGDVRVGEKSEQRNVGAVYEVGVRNLVLSPGYTERGTERCGY